jgi:hypothetical protein
MTTERSQIIQRTLHDLSYGRFGFNQFINSSATTIGAQRKSSGKPLKQPSWKSNNPNPNHFYRYNYLTENELTSQDDKKPAEKKQDRLVKTLLNTSQHKLNLEKEKSTLNQNKIEDLIMVSHLKFFGV